MTISNTKINMKSRGLMFITYYKKEDEKLVKVDEQMVRCKRKDIEESLAANNMKMEYVTARPEKIQLGVLYILPTPKGRPDYIYTHQIKED